MILPLFERELTNDEIAAFAREMGAEMPPVLKNPMEEENGGELPPFDGELLQTVIRMLDHSPFRMHIAYELQDTMVPLISMCIFRDHMLCAIYNRRGVRLAEMMAAEDVKILMLQTFDAFSLRSSGEDCAVALPSPMKLDEFVQLLREERLGEIECEAQPRAHLSALREAFPAAPRICCAFDDADRGPVAWYAVKAQDTVYNVLSDDDGHVRILAGSCLPMINGLCRSYIGKFRQSLKAGK